MNSPADPPLTAPPETNPATPQHDAPRLKKLMYPTAWVCIVLLLGWYSFQLARAGVDVRWGFWPYWQNNRFYSDVDNAFHHGHSC